jgi:predicted double-glycine peptidase
MRVERRTVVGIGVVVAAGIALGAGVGAGSWHADADAHAHAHADADAHAVADADADADARALPANAIAVPLVAQETAYSCGDASILALLRYWDPEDFGSTKESALYSPLHTTPEDGTDPQPMVDFVSGVRGLHAELREHATVADLAGAIDRGEPVVVDLQAWQDPPGSRAWADDWDDGHYAVLVGYDDAALYFMDPSTEGRFAYVPRAEIDARWHDTLIGSNAKIEHAAIFVHGERGKPRGRARGEASRME